MYDDIRSILQPLKSRVTDLRGTPFDIDETRRKLDDFERQTSMPEFWENNALAQKTLKQKGSLEHSERFWGA